VLGSALLSVGTSSADASPSDDDCTPRLLVLSAFPAELDALLPFAQLERTEEVKDRAFYLGRLEGHDVALALTGVGLANARYTTSIAFEHFRCGGAPAISGVVFSGVSGGRTAIGDVAVPTRWTMDGGTTWISTDPAMLATARAAARSVTLARTTPAGGACAGTDPKPAQAITLDRQPRVVLGGDGFSADPFGGRRLPCIPGGGDVFGCEPCLAPDRPAPDAGGTAPAPDIDPNFILEYFQDQESSPSTGSHAADDMETAAAAQVADAHGVPFIGFRALSDGEGDPLQLPGFPAQFFVYKDLAAQNAAAMALAFLRAWPRD
jgi:nucleoside phosphorylase